MDIEIISIGTEILLGEITDTNSAFIARELTAVGHNIVYMTSVEDKKEKLIKALQTALTRSDIIITTGGLGPTADDITREVIAETTEHPLYEDQNLKNRIETYFHEKGYNLTHNNYRQAYLPEKSEPIKNNWGTAPGILLEMENNIIISLPGVPDEMKNMLTSEVIPYLNKKIEKEIKSGCMRFFGIGESTLETELKDILEEDNTANLSLLAGRGEVRMRITASGNSEEIISEKIKNIEDKIHNRVGKYIYGVNNQSLSEVVGELLRKQNLNLSTAESCTGGLIGNKITNIPGSSDYYVGGMVAYSNVIKKTKLGVSDDILKNFGAVSQQTAEAMARGVKVNFNTDIGISVTGIAGPGGGTPSKPVGLVYIGLADDSQTEVYKLNLNGNRLENKWRTSQHALNYLRKYLLKIEED